MGRKLIYISLLMLIVLLVACGGGSGSSPLSAADVNQDNEDVDHDNEIDTSAISVWNKRISIDPLILRGNPLFGFQLFSSPALAADGTIYVGSTDGILYSVDSNGTVKWGYETGDQIVASPAIGSDGTIYVGSADRQLYALNPDGTLKWVYPTKAVLVSSPAIAADGTIYVAGTHLDGTFICSAPRTRSSSVCFMP